jgi:hypothetical protein
MIWLRGHRHPVPLAPAGSSSPEYRHAVLLVDGRWVVDVTQRRFDPDADWPTVYDSIDAAARNWGYVIESEDPDGREHPLPAVE